MRKASEVLLAARAVIEQPEHWTTGALSRPAKGYDFTYRRSNGSVRFCALGALNVAWDGDCANVSLDGAGREAFALLNEAMGAYIPTFNNSRTHAEVLGAFNKAIGLALEAEGPQPELIPAHVGVADCATETTVTGHVALV